MNNCEQSKAHQVCFCSLLQSKYSLHLPSQVPSHRLCNLPDKPLKRSLPDQEVCPSLELPYLPATDRKPCQQQLLADGRTAVGRCERDEAVRQHCTPQSLGASFHFALDFLLQCICGYWLPFLDMVNLCPGVLCPSSSRRFSSCLLRPSHSFRRSGSLQSQVTCRQVPEQLRMLLALTIFVPCTTAATPKRCKARKLLVSGREGLLTSKVVWPQLGDNVHEITRKSGRAAPQHSSASSLLEEAGARRTQQEGNYDQQSQLRQVFTEKKAQL